MQAQPQSIIGTLSPMAIFFFLAFVAVTLGITYWAAKKTKNAAQFYAAGGGITGFQNGLALAGDYMSAASFLGIAGLVSLKGYDGLIYSVGWLVGWPIVMFLISEPLRNLGQVHPVRRGGLPAPSPARQDRRGHRLPGHGAVLHDGPDGRRGHPDQADVQPAL